MLASLPKSESGACSGATSRSSGADNSFDDEDGCLQRQLVERQWPGDSTRHREHEPPHGAGSDLDEEQRAEPLRVGGATEGERTINSRHRTGTDGDEEGVVLDLLPRMRPRQVGADLDGVEGTERDERSARVRKLDEPTP